MKKTTAKTTLNGSRSGELSREEFMKQLVMTLEAVNDGDHTSESVVPQQVQLVAAPEPANVVPADAVVVDPAAPERSATAEQPPQSAAS